jgi:hypothetical protein
MPAAFRDRWQLTPVDDPHGRGRRDQDSRGDGLGDRVEGGLESAGQSGGGSDLGLRFGLLHARAAAIISLFELCQDPMTSEANACSVGWLSRDRGVGVSDLYTLPVNPQTTGSVIFGRWLQSVCLQKVIVGFPTGHKVTLGACQMLGYGTLEGS